MNDLIFLDTETTGLESELHEVWEIAWAINDSPIHTSVVPHSNLTADPKALEMNDYHERVKQEGAPLFDLRTKIALTGNTIVGANPAFDAAFLRKRWGVAPWHYRMIDVESMALGILSYDRPKGLASIANDLAERGYSMPIPDHSAGKDVEVVREVYKALRQVQIKLIDAYTKLVY